MPQLSLFDEPGPAAESHEAAARCGRPCRVAGPGNPDARLYRLAKTPKGQCVDCYTTEFLLNLYPINMDLDEKGPDSLRHPDLQKLYGELMLTARADARLDEIDWGRVIENWDLPVTINRENPTNPYMPVHPRRANPEERYEPHCQAWRRKKPRKGAS